MRIDTITPAQAAQFPEWTRDLPIPTPSAAWRDLAVRTQDIRERTPHWGLHSGSPRIEAPLEHTQSAALIGDAGDPWPLDLLVWTHERRKAARLRHILTGMLLGFVLGVCTVAVGVRYAVMQDRALQRLAPTAQSLT